MKIGVSSYSFSKLLEAKKLTQKELIAKAKEMGFDAIEFVDMPKFGEIDVKVAKEFKKEAMKQDISISCFTFSADFLNCEDGNYLAEIERVKKKIEIAEALGVTLVRHDATTGNKAFRTFDSALMTLATCCHDVTEYAKEKGIRTTVENHGQFCQDSERMEKLVSAVDNENFGLLCDMGNFLCADEDPANAFSRVARYAFYAHAKDFIVKSAEGPNPGKGFMQTRGGNYLRGTIVGHGNVPVKSCIGALKKASYDGVISIEFEGIEDCEYAISTGLENLRAYINE